jgi:signal transduction histidine kinase
MRLSLATRIFLGYSAVLVTFGAVSLFAVRAMHQNQEEIRLVSAGYLPLAQELAALETFQSNQAQDLDRMLAESSVETRRALVRLARLYNAAHMDQQLGLARTRSRDIRAFAPSSEEAFLPELDGRLAELSRRHGEFATAAERLFTLLEVASPEPSRLTGQGETLQGLGRQLGADVRKVRLQVEGRIRDRVDAAEQRARRTGAAIIALSLLATLVGLAATALSARTLRPVRTLMANVSRIGRGDYPAEVGVTGEDDISQLTREVNQMARSLREREAQLREKQEALLRAEQLATVGRVTAQVAHEVRNPLSSIGLNVELLEEAVGRAHFGNAEEAAEAKAMLAAITREVDRLAAVTEQYLSMARPQRQPALQAEDVGTVLDDVLSLGRAELEHSGVSVSVSPGHGEARALVDEAQLKQVLHNLLRNSREAMPGGGRVELSTRADADGVEIEIRDTGCGMTPEVQARIFEPFFTTRERGTGLGLSVSQQVLQAHGGTLRCESAPGAGTTFTLRLRRA